MSINSCLEEIVRPLDRIDEVISSGNLAPEEVTRLRNLASAYSFSILGVIVPAKIVYYTGKIGSVYFSIIAGVCGVRAFEDPAWIPNIALASATAGALYILSKPFNNHANCGQEKRLECQSLIEQSIGNAPPQQNYC